MRIDRTQQTSMKKARRQPGLFVWGLERIRTAVAAFCRAEPSHSATGPSCFPHRGREANMRQSFRRVSFGGTFPVVKGMRDRREEWRSWPANVLTFMNLGAGARWCVGGRHRSLIWAGLRPEWLDSWGGWRLGWTSREAVSGAWLAFCGSSPCGDSDNCVTSWMVPWLGPWAQTGRRAPCWTPWRIWCRRDWLRLSSAWR